MELKRVGRYYTYTGGPSDTYTVYDSAYVNARTVTHEFHPLWYRIKMLYDLLKSKNGPYHWVNRIMLDIQQYGTDHKVKKADLIAMNKMYRKYK